MPEALSCGHGSVSHSCCGEENTQVLDGAPQALGLHLEHTAHLNFEFLNTFYYYFLLLSLSVSAAGNY